MVTFSPKLDRISENIIYLLSVDSRQSVSTLANELKVNRKIVENRVNKLFNEDYIKHLAVTNESNRLRFTVLVKLNKVDETTIHNVKKLKGLLKLKETLGLYDLSILFSVYSQTDMEEAISKLSNILHNKIITFDVLSHHFEDTLGYKSFCHDGGYLQKHQLLSPKSCVLSNDESVVLKVVKKKPSISYVDLAKETGMSYLKLKEINQKWIQYGLVRFSVDPDYEKLGLQFHNILVKIKMGKKQEFDAYLQKHPRIHWVKHSNGRWDYVLSVTARNINEFIDITKQIRTENNDLILDETSLISKVQEARRY
ncbi:Lrp/AsnC family transcriptional regulator [Candidatus Woesearchaeota archaeon]|nr:Lrp/AsnC family transcriptional regulator [Candidatus Woesearchaeota archaeon]